MRKNRNRIEGNSITELKYSIWVKNREYPLMWTMDSKEDGRLIFLLISHTFRNTQCFLWLSIQTPQSGLAVKLLLLSHFSAMAPTTL